MQSSIDRFALRFATSCSALTTRRLHAVAREAALRVAVGMALAGACTGISIAQSVAPTAVPLPPKPDFAPLAFLVGSWTCVRTGPNGSTPTTDTVAFDDTGYWLVESETMQPHDRVPFTTTWTDRVTYDADARRWVDLASTNTGRYTVDTSDGFAGTTWIWHHQLYQRTPEVDAMTDFVLTKIGERKTEATISLRMRSGETRNYRRTCTKS